MPDRPDRPKGHVDMTTSVFDDSTISFYSTHDPYGAFSNFAPYPIILKGLASPVVRHAIC